MTYEVNQAVLIIGKHKEIFAEGVVVEYDDDDGYIGNPEQWLKVRVTKAMRADRCQVGSVYGFRRPRNVDLFSGWRKGGKNPKDPANRWPTYIDITPTPPDEVRCL